MLFKSAIKRCDNNFAEEKSPPVSEGGAALALGGRRAHDPDTRNGGVGGVGGTFACGGRPELAVTPRTWEVGLQFLHFLFPDCTELLVL